MKESKWLELNPYRKFKSAKQKQCASCFKTFNLSGANQKYCDGCMHKHKQEYQKELRKRINAQKLHGKVEASITSLAV